MALKDSKKEEDREAIPTHPDPQHLDSPVAKIARFALGSIFGLLFIVFCFLMLAAALRGPDTIKVGSTDNTFGLVTAPSQGRLKIGDPAPDFRLEQLGGEPVQLSKLRGKIVFLNFWASWCQPCEQEMPEIQRFYQKYKDDDVVVLAINVREGPEVAKSYFKNHNLTMPVLLDRSGEVPGKGYRVTAYPESYFVDKNGRIGEFKIGVLDFSQLEAKLQATRAKDVTSSQTQNSGKFNFYQLYTIH